MTKNELLKVFDNLDDGQEYCEPIARPIPGLTLGDIIYLSSLIMEDMEQNGH